jgi:hypothetical protein
MTKKDKWERGKSWKEIQKEEEEEETKKFSTEIENYPVDKHTDMQAT